MEKQIHEMADEEVQERIRELENAYTELLADGSSAQTLTTLWKEIQVLQAELRARAN